MKLQELAGKHACKRLCFFEKVSDRLAAWSSESILSSLLKSDKDIQQLHLTANIDRVMRENIRTCACCCQHWPLSRQLTSTLQLDSGVQPFKHRCFLPVIELVDILQERARMSTLMTIVSNSVDHRHCIAPGLGRRASVTGFVELAWLSMLMPTGLEVKPCTRLAA